MQLLDLSKKELDLSKKDYGKSISVTSTEPHATSMQLLDPDLAVSLLLCSLPR